MGVVYVCKNETEVEMNFSMYDRMKERAHNITSGGGNRDRDKYRTNCNKFFQENHVETHQTGASVAEKTMSYTTNIMVFFVCSMENEIVI